MICKCVSKFETEDAITIDFEFSEDTIFSIRDMTKAPSGYYKEYNITIIEC